MTDGLVNAAGAVSTGEGTQTAGQGVSGAGAVPGATVAHYAAVLSHVAGRAPDQAINDIARALAVYAPEFGQDRPLPRMADFIAQTCNETGGYKRFAEDLRYRADTLVKQWPSHFTPAQAAAAVGNPVEIASRAYGGRMGNAPYPSDDGYVFRGRGCLQLTGRAAYRQFAALTGLPLETNPDLAAEPFNSVLIALHFYKATHVNAAIDRGDFAEARRITNGGSIGLDNVNRLRAKAMEALA